MALPGQPDITAPPSDPASLPDYFLVDERNKAFVKGQTGAVLYRQEESRLGFIILLVFFIIPAVLFVPPLFRDLNNLLLHNSGASTTATVTEEKYQLSDYSYHLTYQYTVASGGSQKTFSNQETVSAGVAYNHKAGATATVFYDRNNPANVTLLETTADYNRELPSSIFGSAVALLFLIGAIVSFILLRRRIVYDRQLTQDGKIVTGEIVAAHGQSRGARSPTYFVDIGYSFRDPVDGEERTGIVHFVRNNLAGKLPKPGTPVAVIYLDATHHLLL